MKKKQLVVHIKKHLHGVAIESMTYASAIMDSMVGVRNSVYKRTCTYAYVDPYTCNILDYRIN